jgi:hypothetical protein
MVLARYGQGTLACEIGAISKSASVFTSYGAAVYQAQAELVGGAARGLFEYIETLHNRLAHREPFASILFFHNWDYGTPKQEGTKWACRVWCKSGGTDWEKVGVSDPNLLVVVDFAHPQKVELSLLMGNSHALLKKEYGLDSATPSRFGLECGAAWEKLLTGSVDYGN